MAHAVNEGKRMFYVGEVPWHGLGTALDKPATSVEAIASAQLDYPIELKEIQTVDGRMIDGKRATVRVDTKVPLGVVGDGYRVVQNVEAFSFFDEVVGEGQAIYHTAGALGAGERIWILAKLPGELIIGKEDKVDEYLCLTNSHDGRSSLKMYFTPIRVVCQNTLSMSMKDAKDGVSIRHSGNIKTKVEKAQETLRLATKFYQEFGEVAKQLGNTKLKKEQVEGYFTALLFKGDKEKEKTSVQLKRQRNELLALWEHGKGNDIKDIKHSAWTAYNSVTEYVDHHKTFKGIQKDPSTRLKNIWFGTGAITKGRAFDGILETAGIKVG